MKGSIDLVMRRLIFLILMIIPCLCFAQHIQAFYYFPEDRVYTPPLYQFLIDYYSANKDNIEEVNGETIVELPKNIKLKKERRTTIIEGFYVQYEWTIFGTGKDVTIHPMDCDIVEIDFKNKKIKEKKSKDDKAIIKPKDLKEKIKKKDKKKAQAVVGPAEKPKKLGK